MELYTVPPELDHYQHPPCLILYIQSPGVWVHKQYLLSHRTSIGPIYTSPGTRYLLVTRTPSSPPTTVGSSESPAPTGTVVLVEVNRHREVEVYLEPLPGTGRGEGVVRG